MKFKDALKIIYDSEEPPKQPTGYMVSFEVREHGILRSDHFPDKHAGEQLIKTEDEAWELAMRFHKAAGDDYVNIYVTDQDFHPVKNYNEKRMNKWPPWK